MAFEIAKILNHGTSHPVVARLHVQTSELINFTDLSQEAKDKARTIYFEAAKRLLYCDDLRDKPAKMQLEQEDQIQPSWHSAKSTRSDYYFAGSSLRE